MMNEERLEEIIQKYECVLKLREAFPDDSNGYKSVTKVMQEFLQDLSTLKEDKDNVVEMDDRDNDLVNIFNTSPDTETKSDLYMRIIEYLVKKGFLQKGISE